MQLSCQLGNNELVDKHTHIILVIYVALHTGILDPLCPFAKTVSMTTLYSILKSRIAIQITHLSHFLSVQA
jgi:hypothetical protein